GVFGTFDSNNDGVLSAAEFEDFYVAMGLDVAFAQQIYGRLDLDANSSISLDELWTLVDQFLRSDDPDAPGNQFFGPVA
ncbi:MAG: EF-hand domain-containing protein, partial [Chloroflexota bacterium]